MLTMGWSTDLDGWGWYAPRRASYSYPDISVRLQ